MTGSCSRSLTRNPVSAEQIDGLVNASDGLISREIFTDEDIYQLELEKIFGKCWLLLAHESQFTKPGDFFTTFMGEDPVVVVKQRDGSIKAFLNSCPHRGMRVCRSDAGNAKSFMCAYHGWGFSTGGELINVPYEADGYFNEIDKSRWGLPEVTRVANYKGLIFGTWSNEVPELEEYLGEMKWYLDAFVDRRGGGTIALEGVTKWRLKGNWKLAAEQFTTDNYHAPVSHASAIRMVKSVTPKDIDSWGEGEGAQFSTGLGHGTGFSIARRLRDKLTARGYPIELLDYYDDSWNEMVERLGEERLLGPLQGHANVFPTCSYLPGINTLRVWHPRGPNEMEVYAWTLIDRDAPENVKLAQRRYTSYLFGAAGMLEQDDCENWAEIQNVFRGHMQKRQRLNYQMGLGHERTDDPRYPGRIGGYVTEAGARGFYARYKQLLMAESFPQQAAEF